MTDGSDALLVKCTHYGRSRLPSPFLPGGRMTTTRTASSDVVKSIVESLPSSALTESPSHYSQNILAQNVSNSPCSSSSKGFSVGSISSIVAYILTMHSSAVWSICLSPSTGYHIYKAGPERHIQMHKVLILLSCFSPSTQSHCAFECSRMLMIIA